MTPWELYLTMVDWMRTFWTNKGRLSVREELRALFCLLFWRILDYLLMSTSALGFTLYFGRKSNVCFSVVLQPHVGRADFVEAEQTRFGRKGGCRYGRRWTSLPVREPSFTSRCKKKTKKKNTQKKKRTTNFCEDIMMKDGIPCTNHKNCCWYLSTTIVLTPSSQKKKKKEPTENLNQTKKKKKTKKKRKKTKFSDFFFKSWLAPTLLASAWTNVVLGGDRTKEAIAIYQDLISKYGPSPMLLNGLALAFMHQKRYQDAEGPLMQALERVRRQKKKLKKTRFLFAHLFWLCFT